MTFCYFIQDGSINPKLCYTIEPKGYINHRWGVDLLLVCCCLSADFKPAQVKSYFNKIPVASNSLASIVQAIRLSGSD